MDTAHNIFCVLDRINITPESASRPRLSTYGIFNTEKYVSYKSALEWELKKLGWRESDCLKNVVSLSVRFGMPMPKTITKEMREKRGYVLGGYCACPKDVDNLLKAIMDSMFKQDKLVVQVFAEKVWAEHGKGFLDISYSVLRDKNKTNGTS